MGALYADDAVLMSPDEPMVRGAANIQARIKEMRDEDATAIKLTPIISNSDNPPPPGPAAR